MAPALLPVITMPRTLEHEPSDDVPAPDYEFARDDEFARDLPDDEDDDAEAEAERVARWWAHDREEDELAARDDLPDDDDDVEPDL